MMKNLYSGASESIREWDSNFTEEMVNFVVNNPWFNTWDAMFLNLDTDNPLLPDVSMAVSNLLEEKTKNICSFNNIINAEEYEYQETSAQINKIENAHRLSINIEGKYLPDNGHVQLLDYWMQVIPKLSTLTEFRLYHFVPDEEFSDQNDLEPAMICNILNPLWIHILGPSFYEKEITKENLLATPAYKVEELHDGIVMIQTYENPFEYDTPEAIEYMRNVSNHLIENALW